MEIEQLFYHLINNTSEWHADFRYPACYSVSNPMDTSGVLFSSGSIDPNTITLKEGEIVESATIYFIDNQRITCK